MLPLANVYHLSVNSIGCHYHLISNNCRKVVRDASKRITSWSKSEFLATIVKLPHTDWTLMVQNAADVVRSSQYTQTSVIEAFLSISLKIGIIGFAGGDDQM